MDTQVASTMYSVPTYRPAPETNWYHFLHGNVPGHQIDFMYQPEIPSGDFTQQHFSHLARFVKYIEPRRGSGYAFAIGNLSRDDTQYEPGHGGVAFLLGLRIHGAKDHAGRQDPPFCHAAAVIDRHLSEEQIYATTMAFGSKLLSKRNGQTEGGAFYHEYLRLSQHPLLIQSLFRRYTSHFNDLPSIAKSGLGLRWTVEGTTPPRRVTIVHPDGTPFEVIAAYAARIAAVLVESDIRWTCITTGSEADIAGGTTVRFVAERDVVGEKNDGVRLRLEEVPDDTAELAAKLFGARDTQRQATVHVGWRQAITIPTVDIQQGTPVESPISTKIAVEPVPISRRQSQREKARLGLLIGGVGAFAVAGLLIAIGLGMQQESTPAPMPPVAVSPPAVAVDAPPVVIDIEAPALTQAPKVDDVPVKRDTPRVTTVANKPTKKGVAAKKEEAPTLFTMVPARE